MPLLEPITFQNVPFEAFSGFKNSGLPEELPHSFSGLHPTVADAHSSVSFAAAATWDVTSIEHLKRSFLGSIFSTIPAATLQEYSHETR
jgi:hypothetical protein